LNKTIVKKTKKKQTKTKQKTKTGGRFPDQRLMKN
jgi:hypothetical protein